MNQLVDWRPAASTTQEQIRDLRAGTVQLRSALREMVHRAESEGWADAIDDRRAVLGHAKRALREVDGA
ncbi:hypothetical protein BN2364_4006 [Alloalcanivorax xenomutans]|uniref:hypothetical protein n=1 Tax=Alloalcanivorax xenomutans TaxID=1094342 RepID=UPI0006D5BE1B|nr:hypothetical protein [Alloalcanivorax xenomutans]CUR48447.1 hypothetical protein BN2364_4006 [Alloalcanivorax xenomutans]